MRYAIYFVPSADDRLWQAGNLWLGRDPESGAVFAQNAEDALATAEPRRYGFHATLKPPFTLASDRDPAGLEAALADFACERVPFEASGLKVSRLGRFVALVPNDPTPELHILADACVRSFEPFRAPLSDAEIARRRPADLTPRQADYLLRWGYPYVFEEFRFHMTLTGSLDPVAAQSYENRLEALFAPILSPRIRIREIALFVEPAAGEAFRLMRRFLLGSSAAR
jgi:putative phosphonate metabolism protein